MNGQPVWERFIDGEKEAFAIIYSENIDTLFRYGTKLHHDEASVKDAIQEVFYDFYIRRKSIKNPQSIKFYLILALKRNLVRKLHAERRCEGNNGETNFFTEPDYGPEYQTIKAETEAELENKIKDVLLYLPPKQKEAIYLRFNETLSFDEIAKILNISVESVRTQVYRAIKTIRKALGNKQIITFLSFFYKKMQKNCL